MNRQRAKELLPIIQAFAEGKAIQFRLPHHGYGKPEWLDLPEDERLTATFPSDDYEYRIKPEPMEIWVNIKTDGSCGVFSAKEQAEYTAKDIDGSCDYISIAKHFREVTE